MILYRARGQKEQGSKAQMNRIESSNSRICSNEEENRRLQKERDAAVLSASEAQKEIAKLRSMVAEKAAQIEVLNDSMAAINADATSKGYFETAGYGNLQQGFAADSSQALADRVAALTAKMNSCIRREGKQEQRCIQLLSQVERLQKNLREAEKSRISVEEARNELLANNSALTEALAQEKLLGDSLRDRIETAERRVQIMRVDIEESREQCRSCEAETRNWKQQLEDAHSHFTAKFNDSRVGYERRIEKLKEAVISLRFLLIENGIDEVNTANNDETPELAGDSAMWLLQKRSSIQAALKQLRAVMAPQRKVDKDTSNVNSGAVSQQWLTRELLRIISEMDKILLESNRISCLRDWELSDAKREWQEADRQLSILRAANRPVESVLMEEREVHEAKITLLKRNMRSIQMASSFACARRMIIFLGRQTCA